MIDPVARLDRAQRLIEDGRLEIQRRDDVIPRRVSVQPLQLINVSQAFDFIRKKSKPNEFLHPAKHQPGHLVQVVLR